MTMPRNKTGFKTSTYPAPLLTLKKYNAGINQFNIRLHESYLQPAY